MVKAMTIDQWFGRYPIDGYALGYAEGLNGKPKLANFMTVHENARYALGYTEGNTDRRLKQILRRE